MEERKLLKVYPPVYPTLLTGERMFQFFDTPVYRLTMSSPYKYEKSSHGLMKWLSSELEHVGRIIAMKDPHLQKSYAMSTVNGMAHLKDALYEAVQDSADNEDKTQLLRAHDAVIRVMKHLIADFKIDVNAIKAFNTEKVLSNLSYLQSNKNNKNNNKSIVASIKNAITRKNREFRKFRKNRKNTRKQ